MKLGRFRSCGTAAGEPGDGAAGFRLAHDHPKSSKFERSCAHPAPRRQLSGLRGGQAAGAAAGRAWRRTRGATNALGARAAAQRIRPTWAEGLTLPVPARRATGPAAPGPRLWSSMPVPAAPGLRLPGAVITHPRCEIAAPDLQRSPQNTRAQDLRPPRLLTTSAS